MKIRLELAVALAILIFVSGASANLFKTIGPDAGNDYVTDGSGDDVQFNAAIDALASRGGGTLFCQAANYDLDADVTVHKFVTVQGENFPWQGQASSPSLAKRETTRFVIDRTAGTAAFILDEGACLKNLQFYYPNQQISSGNPITYPPTVKLANTLSDDNSIEHCLFSNSYIAIDATAEHDRLHVIDCRGFPIYKGIDAANSYDVDRYEQVHWNPNYAAVFDWGKAMELLNWTIDNGYGFKLGRLDWGEFDSCFMFGYRYGFYVDGGTSLRIYDCGADACKTCIIAMSIPRLEISRFNGECSSVFEPYYRNVGVSAIYLYGCDYATISNCQIPRSQVDGIKVVFCDHCVITGNNVQNYGLGGAYVSIGIQVSGDGNAVTGNMVDGLNNYGTQGMYISGDSISVTGNVVSRSYHNGMDIVIADDTTNFVVTGNTATSGLDNRAGTSATKIVEHNVV